MQSAFRLSHVGMLAKSVNEFWKFPLVFMLPVTVKIQLDLILFALESPVMTLLATTLTCVLMSTLLSNVLDAVHTLCLIEVSFKWIHWKLSRVLQTRTTVRTPTHTLKTPTCIS
jgi:hypothetical protein